jgi:ArsR family transcriptional regulator, lead/cadmium/zinc/bismuth-responsive transcriptional repressor
MSTSQSQYDGIDHQGGDREFADRVMVRGTLSQSTHTASDDARPDDVCTVEVIDHVKVARARRALPAPGSVAALTERFRALGDRTRILIVAALSAEDELCVCDLATLVGVSDSAVSHSLRTLRHLRVVRYRKVGKIAYYALDDAHVARLVSEGVRHVEGSA